MRYCAVLCFAVLAIQQHTCTYYCCTAVAVYRYSGSTLYARSQRSVDWNDRLVVKQMIQQFRSKQVTCECQELHAANNQTERSMHAHTYNLLIRALIGSYLVCCLGVALCCALPCSRFNVIHTRTYYCEVLLFVAVYVPVQHKKQLKK